MKQTTKPVREPVTLDEVKLAVDVEHTDHDTELTSLMVAARMHVESVTRQKVARQKWRLYFDKFASEMHLRPPYVREVEAIQYIDTDGNTQTAATSLYNVDVSGQRVLRAYGENWPATRYEQNAVWIDVWTGMYDETASPIDLVAVEEPIKRAIMLHVKFHYDQDFRAEAGNDPKQAIESLLTPYWMPGE